MNTVAISRSRPQQRVNARAEARTLTRLTTRLMMITALYFSIQYLLILQASSITG